MCVLSGVTPADVGRRRFTMRLTSEPHRNRKFSKFIFFAVCVDTASSVMQCGTRRGRGYLTTKCAGGREGSISDLVTEISGVPRRTVAVWLRAL